MIRPRYNNLSALNIFNNISHLLAWVDILPYHYYETQVFRLSFKFKF